LAGGWPGITALVMVKNDEKTNPRPARVDLWLQKASVVPEVALLKKTIAIALGIVAHQLEVVPRVKKLCHALAGSSRSRK
jgi:hypothetical protein